MKKYLIGLIALCALLLSACTTQQLPSTLGELQSCEIGDDCVYVDNSCCPWTEFSNVVAINQKYADAYALAGSVCFDDVACQENRIEIIDNPTCNQGKCV